MREEKKGGDPQELYQLSVWDLWSPRASQSLLDDVHRGLVTDPGVSALAVVVADALGHDGGQILDRLCIQQQGVVLALETAEEGLHAHIALSPVQRI